MALVYLGLGTNLGDKEKNLRNAIHSIEKRIGKVVSLSAFYETAPWGFTSQNTFLNAVICIDSDLSPQEILTCTQAIEKEQGRSGKSLSGVYSDRLIDIDLLLYGNEVIHTKELQVPHPLMTERLFVMEPLAEIAPCLIHPVFKKNMKDLLTEIK